MQLSYTSCFLSFDGGICRMSRYLAIVLLATVIFFRKQATQLAVAQRFLGFSSATSCLITSLIAVDETSPPKLLVT